MAGRLSQPLACVIRSPGPTPIVVAKPEVGSPSTVGSADTNVKEPIVVIRSGGSRDPRGLQHGLGHGLGGWPGGHRRAAGRGWQGFERLEPAGLHRADRADRGRRGRTGVRPGARTAARHVGGAGHRGESAGSGRIA